MPTKRAGTCAVAVGDKIVAMSGVAVDQSPLDTVEVYNISAKKWETKDTLKEKLLGLSAVVRGRSLSYFNRVYSDYASALLFSCYF